MCEQGGGFRLLYCGYHLEVPPVSPGGQSNSYPEGVCGFNFVTTRSNWEHLVLSALSSPPFEPLAQAEVKWLSIKTAFLLAITSVKRVEELETVSISDSCMRWGPGGSGVTLWPNVVFLPKVLPRRHHNQPIYLARFEPPPAENAARVLCPVRVLAACLYRCHGRYTTDGPAVRVLRGARTGVAPFLDSVCGAGSWILSPVLTAGVRYHSTRGISTSWAALRGIPLDNICAAAYWVSSSTFHCFSRLDVASSHPLGVVLHPRVCGQ